MTCPAPDRLGGPERCRVGYNPATLSDASPMLGWTALQSAAPATCKFV
jgi:hypothetical protein